MASLQDWKHALASGVTVHDLLSITADHPPKSLKDALPMVDKRSKGRVKGSMQLEEKVHKEDRVPEEEFKENLKIVGFLKDAQEFRWCSMVSLPDNLKCSYSHDTHNKTADLAVIPPSIAIKELLGPCVIGTRIEEDAPTDDSDA